MNIFWIEKTKGPNEVSFKRFIQQMANRAIQGYFRYGIPNKNYKYQTRIELELRKYKETGNRENLLNIAVYCWLESEAPENPDYHFDSTVSSATRGRV